MEERFDIARSVHLSASAGSGKTRALKDRYLALLNALESRGLHADQAIAITFTDKAAAEIRERVLADLPEEMLKKVIRGAQDLRISTIHSFCMNLLKRYPLEAGLPPDFGVLDARDQAFRVARAVEDALEASDSDEALMAPLLGRSADDLVEILTHLLAQRSRILRMEIDAGGPEEMVRSLQSTGGCNEAEAVARALIAGEEWQSAFLRMQAVLNGAADGLGADEHGLLAGARDLPEAARIAATLEASYFTALGALRKKPPLPKKGWQAKDRHEYEDLYHRIQDLLGRLRESLGLLHACREDVALLRLFFRAEERYREAKLREGVLDFDDLELGAYRLLRSLSSPDILYRLDRRILHFLVDEFQDTSDIQWAVLDRLTEEIFAGAGADKPMHPTLFVVGDRKQSIYRFREANYRLIDLVRERMERFLPPAARAVSTLDKNYRSVPEIVASVNRVFGALWGDEYQPAEPDRTAHHGSARLIELDPDDHHGSEAMVLAREIRDFVARGTCIALRRDEGWRERPAGYGDCAILIQSRTNLKEYESALQQEGVPFRVVGGIGFYEEAEIQAILNTLFFLGNSRDRLSLAAALASPLFGMTGEELPAVFLADDARAALAALRPDAAGLLDRWGRIAGMESLAGMIRRIIAGTGAMVRFGRIDSQAVFNLDKLLDLAHEFDRRGYTTLQDFVDWVRHIREAEQREAAADLNLPGESGAVSIMTVHKAKGLEFPVLFLPGMNQAPRSFVRRPRVLIASGQGVRMAVKGDGNSLYAELWEQEQQELIREHQRLLYVAMTRARDHLVMIGTTEQEGRGARKNTWLDFLRRTGAADALRSSAEPPMVCSPAPPRDAGRDNDHLDADPATTSEPFDAGLLLDRIRPLAVPAAAEWKKATDLLDAEREWIVDRPMGPAAGGVSPLTRGSFLHRCLELFTKTGGFDPEAVAVEFPELGAIDEATREAFLGRSRSLVADLTADAAMGWIFAPGPGAWSELPFLRKHENTVVSGIIDRVVLKDGALHVIDYKAIAIETADELAQWIGHYRPQLRIYCDAAKEIFGIADCRAYLLFLDSHRLAPVAL